MKPYIFLIVGLTLSAMGCAEKEQAAPEPVNKTQAVEPVVEAPAPEKQSWQSDAFLEHMHRHAEQLDELNFALEDGDLEAARTPAYWLSQHQTVDGVPDVWQPYLTSMRESARAVEKAADLAAALTAAKAISMQCQGCHDDAGINNE